MRPMRLNHNGMHASAADSSDDRKGDRVGRNAPFAHDRPPRCSPAQIEYDLNCDGVFNASNLVLLTGSFWSDPSLYVGSFRS